MSRFWLFSERRTCPRWRVAMNVVYSIGEEMIATSSVEISEQAISIYSRKPMEPGTVLDLSIATDGNERWIKVKGKVSRSGSGIVALEFLNLGKRDIEDLGMYLRTLQSVGKSELIAVG